MIIANGTIAMKRKRAGGIDPETGRAVSSVELGYSEARPCQIVTTAKNQQAQHEGEAVTTASYQVLIDGAPIEGEQVRLCDDAGRVIGDFSIRWQEELRAVRQWRLWMS